MAFRATNIIPETAYNTVRKEAAALKEYLVRKNTEMASSGADYDRLQSIAIRLIQTNAIFNNLKTTPGLAAYAQDQENDPVYDVVAEFAAMQSAIASALAWMDSNIPLSVNLSVPSTWSTSSTPITNSFNTGQTNGFRTELTAIANSIV